MENIFFDVIVVGAGPAGSTTATYAARGGMKVLLLDKREQIGSPVRCGEYLPALNELRIMFPAVNELDALFLTSGSPIRLAAGVPKAASAVQYGGIYETAERLLRRCATYA